LWDSDVLREAAWVIVGCVECVAGGVVSAFAVAALVAWDMMGNKHSVAHFDAFGFAPDFAYDASCFMTQDTRRLGNTVPFQDVAAAYAACHNFKQCFIFADVWHGYFFDADVVVVVVEGGKHVSSLK
jgi:hypothetical protein